MELEHTTVVMIEMSVFDVLYVRRYVKSMLDISYVQCFIERIGGILFIKIDCIQKASAFCFYLHGKPTANCEVDGEVRLAGGSGPNKGRVEFCYRRVFGTVCGSQWDTIDAQVICRQFGYPIEGEIKVLQLLHYKCNSSS
jgi:deleted-in-malignant-brain-tumors protein 1